MTRWLATIAGVGLLAAVVVRADTSQVLLACSRVGWAMALLALAPVVGYALHTLAWGFVLPAPHRPRFGELFSSYLAAQTVDDLVFGVAGEPLKALALPLRSRPAGWSALVADNAAQLAANAVFLAAIVAAVAVPASTPVPAIALGASAVLLAGIVVALLAAQRRPASHAASDCQRANDLAGSPPEATSHSRLPAPGSPGGLSFLQRPLARAWDAIAQGFALMRRDPGRLGACFGLHLLGKAWMIVEIGIALYAVGEGSVFAAAALSAGGSLGALAGAPIPGQVGALEAAYGATGIWAGVPVAAATAVALLRRARSLPWTLLGLVAARSILHANPTWTDLGNRSGSFGGSDAGEPYVAAAPAAVGQSRADAPV